MNVAVVGANGFLGRAIVKKCLEKKWQVTCVYNKHKDGIPDTCPTYTVEEFTTLPDASHDVIFLTAAFIPYGAYNIPDHRFVETNILLPAKISSSFPDATIVYASSASVYGDTNGEITEDSPLENPTLYGLSKLAGESVIRNHKKSFIIRFTSLFGPGMTEKTFLPAIIHRGITDKIIPITDGKRKQNYLFIENAADLCLAASESDHYGLYIGADDNSYTNEEVGNLVARYIPGVTVELLDTNDPGSYVYSNDKAKKHLNFTPTISFDEGIRRMCNK